jgi:hypothetical protein
MPRISGCEAEEARTYLHNRKDNREIDYMTTYIERNRPQATPVIHLGVDIDPGVTLTPAEARRLGAACSRWRRWRGCRNHTSPRP